jgi:hypothetical protein
MAQEWSGFRNYPMRNVDARLKIAPWSNVGAKGMLQQAWFRVKDIPTDQRSIRTVAKVGGLVGKVLEIDEKSRLRPEFVRMRIACRDITKVPRKAKGTLGLAIHYFIFEREVQQSESGRVLSSGIRVGESDTQPPPKKQKVESSNAKQLIASVEQHLPNISGAKNGKQVCTSAPPKCMVKPASPLPMETNAKEIVIHDDQNDKVHIPETFDDSDAESETLSEKIRRIDGYGDLGQGSSTT